VSRAVALIETDMTTALQSAGERADRMSMFATLLGDPALVNIQSDRYRSVSAAQVNVFAEERLGKNNRAKLLYVPRSGADQADPAEMMEAALS
jgi:hypothetical protein